MINFSYKIFFLYSMFDQNLVSYKVLTIRVRAHVLCNRPYCPDPDPGSTTLVQCELYLRVQKNSMTWQYKKLTI